MSISLFDFRRGSSTFYFKGDRSKFYFNGDQLLFYNTGESSLFNFQGQGDISLLCYLRDTDQHFTLDETDHNFIHRGH